MIALVLGHARTAGAATTDYHYIGNLRPREVRLWLERWSDHVARLVGVSESGGKAQQQNIKEMMSERRQHESALGRPRAGLKVTSEVLRLILCRLRPYPPGVAWSDRLSYPTADEAHLASFLGHSFRVVLMALPPVRAGFWSFGRLPVGKLQASR